ncbi:MAG: hypothetical protein AB7O67_05535 [Vicinamibacterales bacterium]
MVPVLALAVPILLSAVLVFVASSVMHMVLHYHDGDVRKVPNEDAVMNALRPFNLRPGDYVLPHPGSHEALKSPGFQEKLRKGPVAFMTVRPSGPPAMGLSLALWFVYAVLIGVFAGYIAGRALAPGTHYLQVFRFVGASAFMGYSLALMQGSIWWGRNWGATLRSMADGLVYALLTAGTFGWLWPS